MKIRKATEKDMKKIAELYKEAYSERPYNEKWTDKTIMKRIKDCFKECEIIVAEIDGEVIGFFMFYVFNWDEGLNGMIEDFAVKKEHRGRGIGKKLMKIVEDKLKRKKVKKIWMQAHKNAKVFKFYKKRGYKENGLVILTRRLR